VKALKSVSNGTANGVARGATYRFGAFALDARKFRLWRDDEVVPLTRKALHTLVALVSHAGDIVDKEDLLNEVWRDTFVTEDTLTQNVSTLRKALGDDPEAPEYIETIPRRGYRFLAPVVEEAPAVETADAGRAWPSNGDIGTAPAQARAARPVERTRERFWMAAAVIASAVAAVLGVKLLLPVDRTVGAPLRSSRLATVPAGRCWRCAPSGRSTR